MGDFFSDLWGDGLETQLVAEAGSGGGFLDIFKDAAGTVKDFYVAYRQAQAQDDLIRLNQERLARGLSPVSADSLAPQVHVGMSPDTKKLLIVGGIAAGALYMMRGRRGAR